MLYNPLEQFNILIFCHWIFCTKSDWVWDNISLCKLFNSICFFFFFFFFSYLLIGIKFCAVKGRNLISLFFIKLKVVFNNNIALKKQIFAGILTVLFIFLTFSNSFGMIPYSSTLTSHFTVTFFLGGSIFLSIVLIGCNYNKFKNLNLFLPGGVPLIITLILICIESISYASKVLSLSIRLFANMLSGHTLLKILLSFALLFLLKPPSAVLFVCLFPLILVLIVMFLETLIAGLQAFIFITLSSVYFSEAIKLH